MSKIYIFAILFALLLQTQSLNPKYEIKLDENTYKLFEEGLPAEKDYFEKDHFHSQLIKVLQECARLNEQDMMVEIAEEFIQSHDQPQYKMEQIKEEFLGQKVLYNFVESWKEKMYKFLIETWQLEYDSKEQYNEFLNEPDLYGLNYDYYKVQTSPEDIHETAARLQNDLKNLKQNIPQELGGYSQLDLSELLRMYSELNSGKELSKDQMRQYFQKFGQIRNAHQNSQSTCQQAAQDEFQAEEKKSRKGRKKVKRARNMIRAIEKRKKGSKYDDDLFNIDFESELKLDENFGKNKKVKNTKVQDTKKVKNTKVQDTKEAKKVNKEKKFNLEDLEKQLKEQEQELEKSKQIYDNVLQEQKEQKEQFQQQIQQEQQDPVVKKDSPNEYKEDL